MKLSIFTPTHDTKYLKELGETILSQSHSDWEWMEHQTILDSFENIVVENRVF